MPRTNANETPKSRPKRVLARLERPTDGAETPSVIPPITTQRTPPPRGRIPIPSRIRRVAIHRAATAHTPPRARESTSLDARLGAR